ncbi:MAG: MaoC family dehydratase [Aeromonas sp.]
MKAVDFLKRKREILAKQPFELKDWLSPAIRDYWREFQHKAQQYPLLERVLDLNVVREHRERLAQERARQSARMQAAAQQSTAASAVVNGAPSAAAPVAQPAMCSVTARVYADLCNRLGQETHVGEWLHVDQALINQFAHVTGDTQWIHTDPARAAQESPFKTTIAHGFLTLALLPQLTQSVDETNPEFPDARMVVNFGLEQVRFPYPIKVDSTVRARTKLSAVTPIKGGLELLKEIKIEIEGVRRPGAVIASLTRIYF